jgi:hypothetical protein
MSPNNPFSCLSTNRRPFGAAQRILRENGNNIFSNLEPCAPGQNKSCAIAAHKAKHDEIGSLAGNERPDLVVDTQVAGAVDRRHLDHLPMTEGRAFRARSTFSVAFMIANMLEVATAKQCAGFVG